MASKQNEQKIDFKGKTCFFISPIGVENSPERIHSREVCKNLINPVLKSLGIAQVDLAVEHRTGARLHRVLLDKLVDSDLIIADLTGSNANVLYELGVRHATQKPCIQLLKVGDRARFDTAHIETLEYEFPRDNDDNPTGNLEAAKDQLRRLINKILAPNAEPPDILDLVDIIPLHRTSKPKFDSMEQFSKRTLAHHNLIHKGRDLCVTIMGPNRPRFVVANADGTYPALQVLTNYKPEIQEMLGYVVKMFEFLLPSSVKVWAAIRDRRADGRYHTFARAGDFNLSRARSTQPLNKDSVDIRRLRASTERNLKCVVITSPSLGPEIWEPRENDHLGDDKSVLMGAVCAKSAHIDGQADSVRIDKLMMVLFVSANIENVFSEKHENLMRCCNDTFSMVINTMLRSGLNNANSEGTG